MNILNLYTADINTYCVDLVNYVLNGKKRFAMGEHIEHKVPYHMLDKLKNTKFIDIYT